MKKFFQMLLALTIGVGLLLGSWYFGKDTPARIFTWESAPGKIFGYRERVGNKLKGMRVAFTYNEKRYEFTTNSNNDKYSVNQRVVVVFPGDDPTKAEIRDYSRFLLLPLMLLIAGLFMSLIGFTGISRIIRGRDVATGK